MQPSFLKKCTYTSYFVCHGKNSKSTHSSVYSHKYWKISLLWFDKTIKIGYLKSFKKNLSEKYNFVMVIIWFHAGTVIWNFFSKMIMSLTRDFFVKFFDRSDMKTGTGSGTRSGTGSGTKFSKKVTCLRTHNFIIFGWKKLLGVWKDIYWFQRIHLGHNCLFSTKNRPSMAILRARWWENRQTQRTSRFIDGFWRLVYEKISNFRCGPEFCIFVCFPPQMTPL